jgi:two-component system response regulator DesR
MNGIDVVEQLATEAPSVRTLIVTTFGRPGYLRRAIDAGASGFVVKDTPAIELADAVRRVHAGSRVVDPDLATESLIEGLNPLSPREQDVLAHALTGAPVAEIARTLHLSAGTVRNYLSTAAAKTQARSSAEAAVIARDRGWL